MMKKLICILVLGVELAACKEAANKKPVTASTAPATQQADSSTAPPDSLLVAVTKTENPPPPPLPFGPAGSTAKNFYKKDYLFYFRLIGTGYTFAHNNFTTFTPVFPLPPIEKYEHAFNDTTRDYCLTGSDRKIPIDSLFSIKKYRVRLPDHKGFEVYYMTGDSEVDPLFPRQYGSICEMNYKYYGFLIFYERATKTARLLPAFYYYYPESEVFKRQFYIDSNYRIFRYSEMMTEGEGGEPDISGGPVEEITINSKGKFTLKKLKG